MLISGERITVDVSEPGTQGPPGPPGPVTFLEPEVPDELMIIPGQPGNQGVTGSQGAIGPPIFLESDPPEDNPFPFPMPGPPGPAGTGIQGLQGNPGVTLFVEPQDPPEESIIVPPVVMGAVIGGITATSFAIGLNRGSEKAPVFASSPNYSKNTAVSSGAGFVESSGAMTINGVANGTNNFYPTASISVVAGQIYAVTIVMGTYTSGTLIPSLGSASGVAVIPVSNQVYVFYLQPTIDGNLSIASGSSGSQHYIITSVSVKRCAFDTVSGLTIPVITDTDIGLSVPRNVYVPLASVGFLFSAYCLAGNIITLRTLNGTDVWYIGAASYANSIALDANRQSFVGFGCYISSVWDLEGTSGVVTGS